MAMFVLGLLGLFIGGPIGLIVGVIVGGFLHIKK